jgi:hypothetical protein
VAKEGASLAITYRRLVLAASPVYSVQQSTDLRSWSTVTTNDTVIQTIGNVQTIKATVPVAGNRMFLRVLISPP